MLSNKLVLFRIQPVTKQRLEVIFYPFAVQTISHLFLSSSFYGRRYRVWASLAESLSAFYARRRFSISRCLAGSRESTQFPESSNHRQQASRVAYETRPAGDSRASGYP